MRHYHLIHPHLTKKSKLYHNWHEHKYHNHWHWLGLVIAISICALVVFSQWQVSINEIGNLSLGLEFKPVQAQQQCTYFISPSDSLSSMISGLKPGDVLCLRDGVYRQSLSISGKSGAPSSPIIK